MRTTTTDIEAILSGQPVPIDVEYPLDDQSDGFQWFMNQPSDWLLDMAYAVKETAYAQVMAMPEMAAAKNLPVDGDWAYAQTVAIENAQKRIDELKAVEERTPEDELELINLEERITLYADPSTFNKAMQIASKTANDAFYKWLLPRLIVDKRGRLIFDVNTDAGQKKWSQIGKDKRDELLTPLIYVVTLVGKAKNSSASQPSSTN